MSIPETPVSITQLDELESPLFFYGKYVRVNPSCINGEVSDPQPQTQLIKPMHPLNFVVA
jgi:hypothetical protein